MDEQMMKVYFEDYLENICEDSKDVKEADRKSWECIKKIRSVNTASDIGWCYAEAIYQHERQGFIGGLMYAAQLFNGKAGVVA